MLKADVTCVVPARLGSSRFPRKLLRELLGKPVVVHSLERASEAGCFSEVLCFTDSLEIGEAVADYGFQFVLTGDAANGTDRIGRNLISLKSELAVNLQGDEPAFPLEGLQTLCRALQANPEWVHTLVHAKSPSADEMKNPNRVKAVLNDGGFVLDFLRTVPDLEGTELDSRNPYRLHLGAYAYSRNYLRSYAALPVSPRETEMSHELLRDLNLAPLRAHASSAGAPVDVPADLELALHRLQSLPLRSPSAPQGVLS